MKYVKNNQIFFIDEIRAMFPNTSIPNDANLEEFGFYKLIPTSPPAVLPWHRIDQAPPDGNVQTWVQIPLTEAEIIAQCSALLEEKLNNFAKERGYDTILAACSYATSTVDKFRNEGQICVKHRDNSWYRLFEILAEVRDGFRLMPTWEELDAELPTLTWIL